MNKMMQLSTSYHIQNFRFHSKVPILLPMDHVCEKSSTYEGLKKLLL